MLPTDALIASYCGTIYKPTAIISGFDHFDGGLDDGVCWALKKLPGYDVVIFRGSVTLRDWIADFRAIAAPSRIGHVHLGFYAGMEQVWSELRPLINQPAIVAGHSLGAARAGIMTGLMVKDGAAPVARVVFGEPKPGLLDFAKLVEGVPARSYRNGDATHHDLVTDVPFSFPPLQYMHPTPIVPVCCKPRGDEFADLGMFAWHHIELYETALAVLTTQEKAA
jgi:Lipase (class 3)